jgi:hypothetical protein
LDDIWSESNNPARDLKTSVDTQNLSPAQRKKVEARAAHLIAEKMTLQELRRAGKLSQVRVAKELGILKIRRQDLRACKTRFSASVRLGL